MSFTFKEKWSFQCSKDTAGNVEHTSSNFVVWGDASFAAVGHCWAPEILAWKWLCP